MSTSRNRVVAEKFANNLLVVITVEDVDRNKGLDFGYADIAGYAQNDEEEVLFNPLNTFKIKRVEKLQLDFITLVELEYG